jgi:hypothetical protein
VTTQATATFAIKSWDEKTWEGKPAAEVTGAKLTRAEVSYTYQGDLEGESTVQYLMSYHENGNTPFIALERFVGRLGGRSGSVVFQHLGEADATDVKGTLTVLPGSGTGELQGLRGQAQIALSGHQDRYPITFDYSFE